MKHRRVLWFALIFIAVLAMVYFWLSSANDSSESQPQTSLAKITRGDIVSTVSATGSLSPVITVQVGSQVSGTIQHLNVDFNSQVKKGDVIAQIDPALFKAKLAEAEANFKSAESARDKAWVEVMDAKRQLQRVQRLLKQNLVSESDVDAAQFAYEAAQVEHKVKTASAAQAKAARDREKVNLAYTTIYAPIDGIVISRDVDVGQTVAASLQAPTLFTIAQDLTQMQIETEVDEAFIGMIQEQQAVSFTVFAYPKRKFLGRVAQIRLNPKIEAGVVKYNCIIHVDNADLALKPGMTATVAIEVARRDNILKAPNTALRFVPDWPQEKLKQLSFDVKNNEAIIWLPDGEDVKPLKVNTGLVGEKQTEIFGDGVSEGMQVVVPQKRQDDERKRRFGLRLF
ncbi:efflux RND transporter periplasmic adaptor subunit [Kaarinaea lacus]